MAAHNACGQQVYISYTSITRHLAHHLQSLAAISVPSEVRLQISNNMPIMVPALTRGAVGLTFDLRPATFDLQVPPFDC
jgi:hypothetical protein